MCGPCTFTDRTKTARILLNSVICQNSPNQPCNGKVGTRGRWWSWHTMLKHDWCLWASEAVLSALFKFHIRPWPLIVVTVRVWGLSIWLSYQKEDRQCIIFLGVFWVYVTVLYVNRAVGEIGAYIYNAFIMAQLPRQKYRFWEVCPASLLQRKKKMKILLCMKEPSTEAICIFVRKNPVARHFIPIHIRIDAHYFLSVDAHASSLSDLHSICSRSTSNSRPHCFTSGCLILGRLLSKNGWSDVLSWRFSYSSALIVVELLWEIARIAITYLVMPSRIDLGLEVLDKHNLDIYTKSLVYLWRTLLRGFPRLHTLAKASIFVEQQGYRATFHAQNCAWPPTYGVNLRR
jgi:hypothetical protein